MHAKQRVSGVQFLISYSHSCSVSVCFLAEVLVEVIIIKKNPGRIRNRADRSIRLKGERLHTIMPRARRVTSVLVAMQTQEIQVIQCMTLLTKLHAFEQNHKPRTLLRN